MTVHDASLPQPHLTGIGIGSGEEAAYELLVDRRRATARQLLAAWRRPEPLPEVLSSLEDKGLVARDIDRPDVYVAAHPRTALEGLLQARNQELDEAAKCAADLVDRYATAGNVASTLVEIVTGQRAIRQRLTQIERGSHREVCCLHRITEPLGGADRSLDIQELVRAGVAVRSVYDHGYVEKSGGLSILEHAIGAGEHARLAVVPMSAIVMDGRVAILPLRLGEAATQSAMIVHPSGLLDALVALFDEVWRRAMPLCAGPTSDSPDAGSHPHGHSTGLVTALLAGLTDQAIARQLGISRRTVQRRISELAQDLHAHSRFQAGVQVALRQVRGEAFGTCSAGSGDRGDLRRSGGALAPITP